MSDTISTEISESAQSPKQVTHDGVTTIQHSLKDQIEADKYLTSRRATRRRAFPIKMAKVVPGSATGGLSD